MHCNPMQTSCLYAVSTRKESRKKWKHNAMDYETSNDNVCFQKMKKYVTGIQRRAEVW